MSPELDFGVKIAGLDLLIYAENKIIQCQLKSNKDTLTGSQAERSVEELSVLPYFASLMIQKHHGIFRIFQM